MRPKLIAILALIVLVLIVLFQNLVSVQTTFLFWSISMPLFVLAIILMMVGFVLGVLTCAVRKK